jgi:hypothetical protein
MATLLSGIDERAQAHAVGDSVVREGMVAGLLGALAVALWFLVIDVVAGEPLRTAATLGAFVSGAGDLDAAAHGPQRLAFAALYTPIHLLAFALLGIVAAGLVRQVERMPSLAALLLMLFVAFEVAFTGIVALLEQEGLGALAWTQVAAGNLVAATVMGAYLLRRHRLGDAWAHRLDD